MSKIDKIRERLAKATPGPWQTGAIGNWRVYGPDGRGKEVSGLVAKVLKSRENTDFIANAPSDIKLLLDRDDASKEREEAAFKAGCEFTRSLQDV